MKSGSVCICQKAVFAVARHPYGYQCKKANFCSKKINWNFHQFISQKIIKLKKLLNKQSSY